MNKFNNFFSLKGLKIFVIGGTGLIGSQIVQALIDFDAKVTVFDINVKKKIKNHNLRYVKFDCTKKQIVSKFFDKFFEKNHCPDVFINASYPTTNDWTKNNFKDIYFETYKKNIEFHLNSYVWLAKIIADKMVSSKIKGSIIQLSSMYGLVAQDDKLYQNTNLKENMTYGVIKSATIHYVKQLASYYGKHNIRANNLVIGGVSGHIKGSKKKQDKNFLKKFNSKVPLKRMGKPEEIPASVIFLASRASSYITGSNIVIDGGYTII